ncbi:MAG: FHA domain-containing protein [Hyphomicrobiaceae bacterium]|nr:FHA domain-containing protein [Hyphomicrobiaceae bacterium]
MRVVNCRLVLTLAIVWAASGFAAAGAWAQDVRLVATCTPPVREAAGPAKDAKGVRPLPSADQQFASLCDIRVTDAVTVQGVTALAKDQQAPLETAFTPFDPKQRGVSVMFLIQVVEPPRYRLSQLMAEAVTKIAEAREGRERYAAYSIANDLTLLAGFDAPKADFDKAVRGLRTQSLPTQLYQATLEAIDKLAKEPGDRKAIVIVGDGNSDDTGYTHEQVVAAARSAGIVIHALGFIEQAAELPRFQLLRRLAEDTGGFRREVRVAREAPRYNVTARFTSEVVENGGTLKINFRGMTGPQLVTLRADLGGGKVESLERLFDIPQPPGPAKPAALQEPARPSTNVERLSAWVRDNPLISFAIGLGFGLAALGFLLFALGRRPQAPPTSSLTQPETAAGKAVVYGWLEMLDGNATRHPLKTTNARIGRHRDNDVCLQNDTISRRHAILHYNPDTKRFVITDLGGDNGVVVNKVRQKSHELNDGDLIELGEVRLRFRPNLEFLG